MAGHLGFDLHPREEWEEQALCATTDPALFYDRDRQNEALTVCEACDVTPECLESALAYESGERETGFLDPMSYGVQGGMTGRERTKIARRRLAQAKAAAKDQTEERPWE